MGLLFGVTQYFKDVEKNCRESLNKEFAKRYLITGSNLPMAFGILMKYLVEKFLSKKWYLFDIPPIFRNFPINFHWFSKLYISGYLIKLLSINTPLQK